MLNIMRNSAYMTACVAALLAFLTAPSNLWAQGKKYRVTIDSQPQGAKVWVDDRAGKPIGKTPKNLRLTPGKHTVFLELSGYEVGVREIVVKERRRGKQTFNFDLAEASMGSIDVLSAEGADEITDGSKVYIDGNEVGTVPDSFEVSAGFHQVEVVKEGFKRFEAKVDVQTGDSVEVTVALAKLGSKGGGSGKKGDGKKGDGKKGDDSGGGGLLDAGPAPILRADVGFGSGIRRFSYNNVNANALGTANILPYMAPGIALANLSLELYFGGFSDALKRFSLFGGASLSLLANSITQNDQNIDTTWLRREFGVRTRLGPIGIDLAEGGNAFTFDPQQAEDGNVDDGIAETTYEYLRLGLWYGAGNDKRSFGVGASGLFVLATGGVADRFVNPSVFGFGGNAWFRMHLFAGIEGSINGTVTYFAYTLQPAANLDTDGGYDLMLDLVGSAGYRF